MNGKINPNLQIFPVASLPAAGQKGRLRFLTTDGHLYCDNGADWDDLTGGGLGERTITFGIRETTTGDRPETAVILPFGGTITKWKLYSETAHSATLVVKKNGAAISGSTLTLTFANAVTGTSSGWSSDLVAENDIVKISVSSKTSDALLILVLVVNQ